MSVQGAHFDGVRAAAAVGMMTSAMLSGAILSSSAFGVPALLTTSGATDAPLSLLRAFERFYNRGKAAVPPFATLSAASFTYAALRASSVPFVTNRTFAAAHRSFLFGAAAALTIGILPYTLLVMIPGIKTLVKGAEDKLEAKKLGSDRAIGGVVAWNAQNWVRGALPLVGCVLGTWASFA
ncbi:hypothetical protein PENSPDRAFT_752003 [Peniophora sp. CONT]|nr:hypothetical protein PENSPDRAFT_752003 [Peniophora sp. CONT]